MVTNYLDKHLKDKEKIDVVDNKGKVISQASRSQVYKAGYLHSAVNIILVNNEGQIFIQKRSLNKTFPLYWDISASEHVKSGEDYKSAAIRGLDEELSIKVPITLLRGKHTQRSECIIKGISIIEYELVELYGTVYEGEIKINQEEIMEGKFISLIKLEELIINKNIKFTPWGLEEINYLFRHQCIISELIH